MPYRLKKRFLFTLIFILAKNFSFSQEIDSTVQKEPWQVHAEVSGFIFPGDFYLNPIVWAKKNHLHLEARYNYEDLQTASAFAGYNFEAANKLYLSATPMFGASYGNTNSVIPGLEAELMYGKFGLYIETEYAFDLNDFKDSFFSHWGEWYYSPEDWIWFGVTTQRIRPQQTELDLQRGVMLALQEKWFTLTGYYFNPFTDDDYWIVNLGATF